MRGVDSAASPARARLGRYEILFRIAAGGMAEVYAARLVGEGGFEKLVALKRMLPELASDERFVAMFLDEGRVAANVSSPYVVQTLDLGRAEDHSLYLVMELVNGIALSSLMGELSRQQRLPPPVAIASEILAQAAQGLHDAHQAKTAFGKPLAIVHRDISPQNVMVDVNGRARITDFGVARALQRLTRTASGEVKGKLAYFAPEQARGETLDPRADVFAFGIVAWELLAGVRLFGGGSPADTVRKVLAMPIPSLDQVRPEVPRALALAVAAALERKPDQRMRSAGELASAIRAATTCAGPDALGAFVRAHGGEALSKLERNLRAQDDSWQGETSPAVAAVDEGSGVVPSGSTPRTSPTDLTRTAPDRGATTTDTSPIDAQGTTRRFQAPDVDEPVTAPHGSTRPIALPDPPHEGTRPMRAPPAASQSTLLAPTAAAAGIGASIPSESAELPSSSTPPAVLSSESAALPPRVPHRRAWLVAIPLAIVVALSVAALASYLGREPTTTEQPASLPTRTIAAPPSPIVPAIPTPSSETIATPAPTPPIDEPVAEEPSSSSTRSTRRRSAPHASRDETTTDVHEPTPPPQPASEAESPPRRGALHGLDDFDRE